MKTCPRCNTVSGDSDLTCGVCGGVIADITPKSIEETAAEHSANARKEELAEQKASQKIDRRQAELTLSEFVLGLFSIVGGIILLAQYGNLYGFLPFALGSILLFHALGLRPIRSSKRYVGWH